MSFEQDIRQPKVETLDASTEKMQQQAKYYLARLEKKAETTKFVKVQPIVCAIQYAMYHSYSREPPKVETTYVYDGKSVYVKGTTKPISKKVLAQHAHYGSMGRGGKYDRKSILELVKHHFLDYFVGKDTETPKPLEFFVSFCGN
jgi:hypothetical protein